MLHISAFKYGWTRTRGLVLAGFGSALICWFGGSGNRSVGLACRDLARGVGGWCLERTWRQRRSFPGVCGPFRYAFASIMLFPAKHDTGVSTLVEARRHVLRLLWPSVYATVRTIIRTVGWMGNVYRSQPLKIGHSEWDVYERLGVVAYGMDSAT